jgi:two-component system response regulator HydG
MKMGAVDYITKPLFPDEILVTIQNALQKATQISSTLPSKSKTASPKKGLIQKDHIAGSGQESKNLFRQLDLVAPTNYSVIIYGESGSGKESIAQEIHARSKRANGPL